MECTPERTMGCISLELIHALKDPAVLDTLRESVINYDLLIDKLSLRLESRFKKMEEEIARRDKRISDLENTVSELALKCDDQEQYSRRTSVRISGVRELPNEDVIQLTNSVLDDLQLPARPVINRVHRVGPTRKPTDPPRPILCQFLSYPDKSTVMKNRSNLKDARPGVYINEDLTRKRSKLLYDARQLEKNEKIIDAWSSDGRLAVKAKIDGVTKIFPLTSPNDLAKFK